MGNRRWNFVYKVFRLELRRNGVKRPNTFHFWLFPRNQLFLSLVTCQVAVKGHRLELLSVLLLPFIDDLALIHSLAKTRVECLNILPSPKIYLPIFPILTIFSWSHYFTYKCNVKWNLPSFYHLLKFSPPLRCSGITPLSAVCLQNLWEPISCLTHASKLALHYFLV